MTSSKVKHFEGENVCGWTSSKLKLSEGERKNVAGQVPSSMHINENIVLESKLELCQAAPSCAVYLSIICYSLQWKYSFGVFSTSIVSEGV